jgi:hypothetical protein
MPQTKSKPTPRSGVQKPHFPKAQFKGRPIYTDEDRKKMQPTMPPEADWVHELLGKG